MIAGISLLSRTCWTSKALKACCPGLSARILSPRFGSSIFPKGRRRNAHLSNPAANNKKAWPQEDIDTLLAMHEKGTSSKEIASTLGRTLRAVEQWVDDYRITGNKMQKRQWHSWTVDDDKRYYDLRSQGLTKLAAAEMIGRTLGSVVAREHRLRCQRSTDKSPATRSGKPKYWTPDELDEARVMRSQGHSYQSIAVAMGRSNHSVRAKLSNCKYMQALRAVNPYKRLSDQERALIVTLHGEGKSLAQIVRLMPHHSKRTIQREVWKLGKQPASKLWTEAEISRLLRLRGNGLTMKQITELMPERTYSAVCNVMRSYID